MITRKSLFLILLFFFKSQCTATLKDQFKELGYSEICHYNDKEKFNTLYQKFDKFIGFVASNPECEKKLYIAKERFIRSKDRKFYSTDFFGFFNESEIKNRAQISFYYSTHYHEFISLLYPDINKIPDVSDFLQICKDIKKSCESIFENAVNNLGLKEIFIDNKPSILFKIIKYLPTYAVSKPHYDGTALSLFLDSTENQSLLLTPYKSKFSVKDFHSPLRSFSKQNSMILIPGASLTEFDIYPSPHLVVKNGKTRYATIAFAMRPNYNPSKHEFTPLINFNIE